MRQLPQQSETVESLRKKHYNATVEEIERVTDSLMILRVRPDDGPRAFQSGQYTVLGLGNWEPRSPDAQPQDSRADVEPDADQTRLVRRAYSISTPIFNEFGHLVPAGDEGVFEFYIAVVNNPEKAAALTPRLLMLKAGDRLFIGPRCQGRYTLERVTNPNDTIVFMGTGCGEAPHNAMIAELMFRKHRGKVVSIVCTRQLADLAYTGMHHLLERAFENYRYLTLTTREPRNLDPTHPHYVGKRYIQDYFATGELEEDAGVEFHPVNTHVFLCGSPAMIGLPVHAHDKATQYPKPTGMIELLEKRGFTIDHADRPGNIHFEKYW